MDIIKSNLERTRELSDQLITDEQARPAPMLKLISGSGDTPPGSGFWLLDLEVGDVFLARQKPTGQNMSRAVELGEYGIFNKASDGAVLLFVVQPGQTVPVWVDGKAFSLSTEKFTVLRTKDSRILAARKSAGYDIEETESDSDLRPVQSD